MNDDDTPRLAVAPPPIPRSARQSRAAKLVAVGVAKDPKEARARIQADRLKRKPRKVIRNLSLAFDAILVEAVELIADRYDTSMNSVVKRFIQDGVRKYGNAEELEHAGLAEPKAPNPFDAMDTAAASPPTNLYEQYRRATPEGRDYMDEVSATPNLDAILKRSKVPLPGAHDGFASEAE